MIAHHRWRLACEFSNWIEQAVALYYPMGALSCSGGFPVPPF